VVKVNKVQVKRDSSRVEQRGDQTITAGDLRLFELESDTGGYPSCARLQRVMIDLLVCRSRYPRLVGAVAMTGGIGP